MILIILMLYIFLMPKVIHIMSVIIYDPYAVKLFVQIWNP